MFTSGFGIPLKKNKDSLTILRAKKYDNPNFYKNFFAEIILAAFEDKGLLEKEVDKTEIHKTLKGISFSFYNTDGEENKESLTKFLKSKSIDELVILPEKIKITSHK